MEKPKDITKSGVHPSTITDFDDLPDDIKDVEITVPIEDILGKEIIIRGYSELKSEYGKGFYILIDAVVDEEEVEIATGAKHVMAQLDKAHKHLPIKARFQKKGRSYYLGKE